ncbi:MAG: flagellar export chaperone FliS [Verrucomicrobia bacterium]|nr:flagellar export chaperone FliS [Verrucomicrobiota bacterium]
MPAHHEPAKAYLRSKILNASPMELVIILYEGAIAACTKARELFGPGHRREACDALIRAQNMVRELRNSLDMSRGDIAGGLYRLYSYMIQRLVEANVRRKPEHINEVLHMLGELKRTWIDAIEKHGGEPALDARLRQQRLNQASPSDNYVSIIT